MSCIKPRTWKFAIGASLGCTNVQWRIVQQNIDFDASFIAIFPILPLDVIGNNKFRYFHFFRWYFALYSIFHLAAPFAVLLLANLNNSAHGEKLP